MNKLVKNLSRSLNKFNISENVNFIGLVKSIGRRMSRNFTTRNFSMINKAALEVFPALKISNASIGECSVYVIELKYLS